MEDILSSNKLKLAAAAVIAIGTMGEGNKLSADPDDCPDPIPQDGMCHEACTVHTTEYAPFCAAPPPYFCTNPYFPAGVGHYDALFYWVQQTPEYCQGYFVYIPHYTGCVAWCT